MSDKELQKWYESARQSMDSLEKIRFIQEIFYQLKDEGVKLPMGDFDEVELYLNQLANKVYSHNNTMIQEK